MRPAGRQEPVVEDAEVAGSMGYVCMDTQAVCVEAAKTAGAYIAVAAQHSSSTAPSMRPAAPAPPVPPLPTSAHLCTRPSHCLHRLSPCPSFLPIPSLHPQNTPLQSIPTLTHSHTLHIKLPFDLGTWVVPHAPFPYLFSSECERCVVFKVS